MQAIDDESPCEVCKVMEAVWDALFNEAVTVAVWALDTAPTRAAKVATLEPAATVADAGIDSAATSLDRVTVTPPEPAALERVTVHVAVPPELRLVGVQVSELRDANGDTAMVAVCELPL